MATGGCESGSQRQLPAARREDLLREVERLRDLLGDEPELRALIHQLEVHREELRRRNEELVDAQRLLEQSRDRYSDLFDFAPVAYLSLDPHGLIREVNLTGAALLGRPRTAVEGLPLTSLVSDPHRVLHHLWRCRRGEDPVSSEVRIDDGAEGVPVEMVSRRRLHADGLRLFTMLHDRRDQISAEHDLAEAVWEEQRRTAEILHDEVGQDLTALGLTARALEQRLAAGGAGAGDLARQLLSGLRSAHETVRELSRRLHPAAVDVAPEDLGAALEHLVAAAEKHSPAVLRAEVSPAVRVREPEVATQLFQIAREALSNALRHGEPGSVTLRLAAEGHGLVLTVEDDGGGFDPAARHEGLGLRLMRHRARRIGGELRIDTPGLGGTRVVCRLVPKRRRRATP